jgi:transglutaminase-like putative cysteine protease
MSNAYADYLSATEVADFQAPTVSALARQLRGGPAMQVTQRCFEWVRDEIRHSLDHQDELVTVTASQVLEHGTGLCYAKSHLLAALLRANGLPCGFVYQRLAIDASAEVFCLHGLNAVWLPDFGWYRVDPRGNRGDVQTSFDPPHERLAFKPSLTGESTFADVLADPLDAVVSKLQQYKRMSELKTDLPDWTP